MTPVNLPCWKGSQQHDFVRLTMPLGEMRTIVVHSLLVCLSRKRPAGGAAEKRRQASWMLKGKLAMGGALCLALGLVSGGVLFSQSQPRSVLAIHHCQQCLNVHELAGLLASVGIQKFPGLLPRHQKYRGNIRRGCAVSPRHLCGCTIPDQRQSLVQLPDHHEWARLPGRHLFTFSFARQINSPSPAGRFPSGSVPCYALPCDKASHESKNTAHVCRGGRKRSGEGRGKTKTRCLAHIGSSVYHKEGCLWKFSYRHIGSMTGGVWKFKRKFWK